MEFGEVCRTPGSLYMGAAFAFLFDRKGRMLLLCERGNRKYMWDLPGGTLADHEQPIDGLRREVLEETKLQIRLVSRLCWLKWDWHESGWPILVAFYVAEAIDSDVRLSDEHVKYRWVFLSELEEEHLEISAEKYIIDECYDLYGKYRTLEARPGRG